MHKAQCILQEREWEIEGPEHKTGRSHGAHGYLSDGGTWGGEGEDCEKATGMQGPQEGSTGREAEPHLRVLKRTSVLREGRALVKARQESNTQGRGHTSPGICFAPLPRRRVPSPTRGLFGAVTNSSHQPHVHLGDFMVLFPSCVDECGFSCPP